MQLLCEGEGSDVSARRRTGCAETAQRGAVAYAPLYGGCASRAAANVRSTTWRTTTQRGEPGVRANAQRRPLSGGAGRRSATALDMYTRLLGVVAPQPPCKKSLIRRNQAFLHGLCNMLHRRLY
ncbi:hypothetical protein CBW46_007980 [Paenibacillus xerothermodurans]|uniref:Uncharacterized protein n=1 Tax=Paenibacillus xerothermodurans TaxID=1977292 RepID=A0A2W1NP82_PAEXE|nr:hypothetical protein CBW46_007980 [Paenibacillus xerothermodurans]